MIPQHTREALDRYVNHKIPTGGFLLAVLSNDLFGAIGQADRENRAALADICEYIYNELPSNCWGSKDIVWKWVEDKFYERIGE